MSRCEPQPLTSAVQNRQLGPSSSESYPQNYAVAHNSELVHQGTWQAPSLTPNIFLRHADPTTPFLVWVFLGGHLGRIFSLAPPNPELPMSPGPPNLFARQKTTPRPELSEKRHEEGGSAIDDVVHLHDGQPAPYHQQVGRCDRQMWPSFFKITP